MKLKMFTLSGFARDHSWITLTVVGISVVWILRKLAAHLRVFGLHKKAVFLTSADGGYGREIALQCATYGMVVYAGCLGEETRRSLEAAARMLKGRLKALEFDITSEESIAAAVRFVREDLPPNTKLWAVLNTNEQHAHSSADGRRSTEDFKALMELNYCAGVRLTHAFLPMIKASQGRVGVLSGVSEHLLLPFGANLAGAHKMALGSYIQFIAGELQHFRIKFAVFEPGVSTSALLCEEAIRERVEQTWAEMSPEKRRELGDEYKVKLLNHWNTVLDVHGRANSKNVVRAAVHFITARSPRSHYNCGPSLALETAYLMLLNFFSGIKSSIKRKQL
ncbi:Short-chain dehydrogenase/reductase family 9C member 7 [Aphelenchoides fujianensis]|nr:Short-chain dehydrogenase/reductase family 9C member 7 [Aphelenchoides fujianensis]